MTAGLGAFIGVAFLVIVTPGQDTALTLRAALRGGRRAGVLTAAGVAAGQAIWALATSAGLVAVLLASEPVFLALRVAGSGYLLYLGLQALRSALRRGGSRTGRAVRAPDVLPLRVAFRQGLLSNLSNPKMAAFFTSLLPQFVDRQSDAFPGLLMLGLLFGLMTLAWLCFYAAAAARAGDLLHRPRVRRALDGVTGFVFVGLGARLATWRPS